MRKIYKREDQIIIKPKGGWKENTFYLVEVAYHENNPVHRDVFFSGFLGFGKNEDYPENYNYLCAQGSMQKINNVYYMKFIKEVVSRNEYEMNFIGMPKDFINEK